MSELVRLRRDRNDVTFGFKLQGGSDFSTPLSILQVTPNSIADYCGLRAGDVIIELNNMNISYLEHQAAKQEIVRAGNDFTLTIIRNGVDTTAKPEYTPLTELRSSNPPQFNPHRQPPAALKTNLAVDKGEVMTIGSSHNRAPMGFHKDVGSTIVYEAAKPTNWKPGDYTKWTEPQQPQPQQPTVTAVFHNPYNTPIGLYSDANVLNAFNHQTKNIIQSNEPQVKEPPKGVNSLSMRMLNSALDTASGTAEQPPSVFDLKNGHAPPGVAIPKGFRSVQAPTLPRPEDRHAPVRKEYAVKNVKESWIEPKIN